MLIKSADDKSKRLALLHDLRLQVDGEVAQIDHLVINRTGYMVLIETQNYSGDLEVCWPC